MKIIDNMNQTVKDDLEKTMKKGSKVSIAAACFSIYVYKEFVRRELLWAACRDSSFASSSSKINAGEIFKMLAPDTRIEVI
jgi:hypothetical protein